MKITKNELEAIINNIIKEELNNGFSVKDLYEIGNYLKQVGHFKNDDYKIYTSKEYGHDEVSVNKDDNVCDLHYRIYYFPGDEDSNSHISLIFKAKVYHSFVSLADPRLRYQNTSAYKRKTKSINMNKSYSNKKDINKIKNDISAFLKKVDDFINQSERSR